MRAVVLLMMLPTVGCGQNPQPDPEESARIFAAARQLLADQKYAEAAVAFGRIPPALMFFSAGAGGT